MGTFQVDVGAVNKHEKKLEMKFFKQMKNRVVRKGSKQGSILSREEKSNLFIF